MAWFGGCSDNGLGVVQEMASGNSSRIAEGERSQNSFGEAWEVLKIVKEIVWVCCRKQFGVVRETMWGCTRKLFGIGVGRKFGDGLRHGLVTDLCNGFKAYQSSTFPFTYNQLIFPFGRS